MSDPIEVLRAACERIKNDTGQRRPMHILFAPSVLDRAKEYLRANIAEAERMLGIGCEPEGRFPTGWPWTKRAGRPSKEEKRLRDCLPGWRSMLKGLEQPIEVARDGCSFAATIGDLGRIDQESRLLAMARGYDTYEVVMPLEGGAPDRKMPLINPNVHNYSDIAPIYSDFVHGSSRRPTGKRAQRRAAKEWNR